VVESVYSAVRTDSLYKADSVSFLKVQADELLCEKDQQDAYFCLIVLLKYNYNYIYNYFIEI
jgi:hypothetical protein